MSQWLELPAGSLQSPDLVHATPADAALVLGVSGWDPVGGLALDVAQSWAFLLQTQTSKINFAGGNCNWSSMNNEYPALEPELISALGRTCKRLVICHVCQRLVIL